MSQGKGLPSPSGARLSGDDYQHMYTWFHVVQLLRDDSGVTKVEFEVGDAGSVDDLVVHRAAGPPLYHQIKFVVDQRDPLTHEWFTTPSRPGANTPLQKFHSSFVQLSGGHGAPEMVLLTNRLPAAGDPLLKHLDGRTDKLTPRLTSQTGRSQSGQARRRWAEHLDVTEDDLMAMLDHLAIKAGRASLNEIWEACTDRMAAAGLRGDATDVLIATGLIRERISTGCRSLDRETLRRLVSQAGFTRTDREATLVIQAIDWAPAAESATAVLDWVDLFAGESAAARRQLIDPTGWNGRLAAELNAATRSLRDAGYASVRLDGAFRLSVGFAAGEALPRTTGVKLSCRGYASDQAPTLAEIRVIPTELGEGADIAIGVSVSTDVTDDAITYLRRKNIPVERFVNITPASGPGQFSIPSSEAGLGFVLAAFEHIRREAAGLGGSVHLFLACPLPIAVMLGHFWNRLPDTQLHDDANGPAGYFPTFSFQRR